MSVGTPILLDDGFHDGGSGGDENPISIPDEGTITVTEGRPVVLKLGGRFASSPGEDLIQVSDDLGITWTHVARHLQATTRYTEVWIGHGGSGSGTITIQSPTGSDGFRAVRWVVEEYPDGGAVRENSQAADGAFDTELTLTLPLTKESGSALVAAFDRDGGAQAPTPRSGWTQNASPTPGGGQNGRSSSQHRLTADTHAGVTWNSEVDVHLSGVAFELEAAEAGLTPAHQFTISRPLG